MGAVGTPGLQDRRVAVYFRLHHAFADGAAALAAFGALLDMTPNAPTPVAPDWRPMPIRTSICCATTCDVAGRNSAADGQGPTSTQDDTQRAGDVASLAGGPRGGGRPTDESQPPGENRATAGADPQPSRPGEADRSRPQLQGQRRGAGRGGRRTPRPAGESRRGRPGADAGEPW